MNKLTAILIVNLIVLIREGSCHHEICPDIFKFEQDGQRFYGIITIPPPGQGITRLEVQMGITYSNNGEQPNLSLVKSAEDTVADAIKGKNIQYLYSYPQGSEFPTIIKITLNFVVICNGHEIQHGQVYTNHLDISYPEGADFLSTIGQSVAQMEYHVPHLTPSTTPAIVSPSPPLPSPAPVVTSKNVQPSVDSWLGSLPFANTCGRQAEPTTGLHATQLIIGGVDVLEGEFPWMVVLCHFKRQVPEPVCGASLISNTYVITAAHCTKNQKRVYLELGKHDISDKSEPDFISRISLKIIEHPEYADAAHGDVALIEIERVEFTLKIRPICLWAQGSSLNDVEQKGTVTGWGQVENGGPSSTTPMKLNVRTVGLDKCRDAHEKLRDIVTNKTFCAGGEGTGPCHGDSGSGLYVRKNDVWYLRGIISTSLGSHHTCFLERYAVYCDITHFLDWMRPYLLP